MTWNLSQQYNSHHFVDRCYDMLDGFEEFDEPEYIATGSLHLKHISSVKKLGEAKGLEDLVVLEIEYNTGSDPRVGLTKEIQKVISKLAIEGYRRDHCLAIIKNPRQESYRLSLISFTYSTEKKLVTNAKRFSFLLGPGEKVKTPTDYLIKNTTKITSISHLTSRFDVEVVRKEFFNLYINLFLELYQEVKKYQYCFRSVNNGSLIDLVSFSKNLMGKMIFLYFIQKKGWLGLTADQNFKDHPGKHNFFKENFENQTLARDENLFQGGVNFYNDFLEPLFYSGLNKKNTDDWHEKLQMKVPYLNGGLFEEEYKDRETTPLPLENNLFKAIVDAFDTYNFTIDENDPMDQEIAVDPEMLGKIFEYMISINSEKIDALVELYNAKKKFKEYPSPDRSVNIVAEIKKNKEINKKLGAFYTPREIVHYMTREALIYSMIEFLSKKLTDKSREELEAIVRELRHCKDKHLTTKDEIEDREGQVATYQTLKSVAFDVKEYLVYDKNSEIKPLSILDPAVGSGAFPMGILQEMTGLVEYLIDTFGLEKKSRYEIKQSIIRDSIYGVDIDPGAVDIARLRFWLSLIVDAHEPIPLPNLEFKFVCANSLIPLENDSLFTNKDVIEKLRTIKNEYFRTSDNDKKEELKMEFQTLKSDLLGFSHKMRHEFKSPKEYKKYIIELVQQNTDAKNRQFQQWEPFDATISNLWFDSEMMFDTDTFDIVIGNPPYIDIKQIDNGFVKRLFELYKTTENRINLYSTFIEKGHSLLSKGGVLVYINPNSMLLNSSYKKLRKLLINDIKKIIKLPDSIFENAIVETIILVSQKDNHENIVLGKYFKFNEPADLENTNFSLFNRNEWLSDLDTKYNIFIEKDIKSILSTIKKHTIPLSEICEFSLGITPYDKYKGHSEELIKNRLFHSKEKSNEDYVPLITGSNIQRYCIYEHVVEYINYGQHLGAPRKKKFFTDPRIIIRQIISGNPLQIYAGYTEKELYNAQIGFSLLNRHPGKYNLKYVLGVINSKLINFYHSKVFLDLEKNTFQKILIENCKNLPIKTTNPSNEKNIVTFVDEIISLKNTDKATDTSTLERTIDILIYKIYELTLEDSQIIDPTLTQEEWEKVDFE